MEKKNDFYLRKICDHNAFEVWLVDGAMIRRDISEDFVGQGYHTWCHYIPQNEIWIEKDTNEDEWKYFLENIDFEIKGLEEGVSLTEMGKRADSFEQKERRSDPEIQKIIESHHERKEALAKIHKKVLDEYCNDNLTVWLIDGEIVRALYRLEYACGGHDLVYDFIPKNEVWVEEVLDSHERKIILIHELHERVLMSQGKDYLHAHHGATIVESHYRHYPEGIDERLKEEVEKNNF